MSEADNDPFFERIKELEVEGRKTTRHDLIEEWETVRQEDAMHCEGDPWWLIDQALIERTITDLQKIATIRELKARVRELEHKSINTVLDASEEYGKLQAQVEELEVDIEGYVVANTQLLAQVKELKAEIKEWEAGVISRRWSEIREE